MSIANYESCEDLGCICTAFYESLYGQKDILELLKPEDIKKLYAVEEFVETDGFDAVYRSSTLHTDRDIEMQAFVFKFLCQENWLKYLDVIIKQNKINDQEYGYMVAPANYYLFTEEEQALLKAIISNWNKFMWSLAFMDFNR